jgi:uncharacterized membrane protein YbhN (UPF0104 family)
VGGFRRVGVVALVITAAAMACAPKPGGGTVAEAVVLPFIENDFAQAVAQARQSNLPLFVEVWAPW